MNKLSKVHFKVIYIKIRWYTYSSAELRVIKIDGSPGKELVIFRLF